MKNRKSEFLPVAMANIIYVPGNAAAIGLPLRRTRVRSVLHSAIMQSR